MERNVEQSKAEAINCLLQSFLVVSVSSSERLCLPPKVKTPWHPGTPLLYTSDHSFSNFSPGGLAAFLPHAHGTVWGYFSSYLLLLSPETSLGNFFSLETVLGIYLWGKSFIFFLSLYTILGWVRGD